MRHKKTSANFWQFFETRICALESEGRWGTAKNYAKTKRSLKTFCDKDTLSIDDITQEFIESYNRFLFKKGLIRNSVSQYNRVLKAVYSYAVKQDLVTDKRPFRNVYTGIDKTLKRALSEKELAQIAATQTTGSLAFAKDLFLFSYTTCGMAFVDLAYLKKSDIIGSTLIYYRHKTGSRIQFKLDPSTKKIIDKYKRLTADSPYVFPILGDTSGEQAYKRFNCALTEYNRSLKKLSQKAGLKNNLTSYVPRHSWATAARNNGADISTVSEGLGHQSERTTRIYLASFDSKKIQNVNKLLLEHLYKGCAGQ